MSHLFHELFALVNIPLTIFMIGLLAYWIFTAFGIFDVSNFEVDIDLDVDMDVDADIDVDSEIDDFSGARGEDANQERKRPRKLSFFEVFMVYFHFVEVPFMMALTIFILIWWTITFLVTHWLGNAHDHSGFVVLFLALIPALFLMKIFTYPIKGVMKKLNPQGVSAIRLEGRIGQTITKVTSEKLGQIQLVVDESPIKVYAKCINKNQQIEENQEILIIKKSADAKFYLIDINH